MSVHNITAGVFACTAPADAACHIYPGCECEYLSHELHGDPPAEGHEPTQQAECWIASWLTFGELGETYYDEDGNDAFGSTFPDGPVEYEWEGDCLTWRYADETVPVSSDEDDA